MRPVNSSMMITSSLRDDVVLVALEQLVGAQRLVDVVHDGDVLGVVEIAALEEPGLAQHAVSIFSVPSSVRVTVRCFSSQLEVGLVEIGDELVDGVVEIGAVVERAGNDQRRARLVDQDRVDFVDDGEDVAALDHLLQAVLHIVAQIVEAELVVGAVGDVAGVGRLALLVVEAVDDDADGQPEEAVDLAHPFGVALGEVVVDGDDVDALAGERVEIDRQASRPGSCLRRSSSRRCRPRAGPCRRSAARRSGAGRACAWRPRARWRKPGSRMSSRSVPSAICFLNSSVRARSASSERAATSASSALMASTRG